MPRAARATRTAAGAGAGTAPGTASKRAGGNPETKGIAGILAQCTGAYKAAEAWTGGGGFWTPPVSSSPYPGFLSSLKVEPRTTKKGADYLFIAVGITIDDPESEHSERETSVTFNSLPNKDKATGEDVFYGLNKLKGFTGVLNDGEAMEDLKQGLDFIQQCVDAQADVNFEVSEHEGSDGKMYRDVTVTELRNAEAESAE